jgi:chromosomal replication initiator protein
LNEKEDVTVEDILKTVASKMNVKVSDMKSHKKNKNLVFSRQIAMYLSRKMTSASFPDIGEKIGGRDHSTVIYANNKIKQLVEEDAQLKKLIREIEECIQNKA